MVLPYSKVTQKTSGPDVTYTGTGASRKNPFDRIQNYETMRMKQEIAGGFLLFLYSAADVAGRIAGYGGCRKICDSLERGSGLGVSYSVNCLPFTSHVRLLYKCFQFNERRRHICTKLLIPETRFAKAIRGLSGLSP